MFFDLAVMQVLGALDHRDDLEDAESLSLASWHVSLSIADASSDVEEDEFQWVVDLVMCYLFVFIIKL